MSETILTKEQGVASTSATYEVTDSPKQFIFSGTSSSCGVSATANIMLNGALVATLTKSNNTFDAEATGEYTIIISPECGQGTVTAEDLLSGASASTGEAQFVDTLCLSDGTTATKYYDVTEEGEVLYGYILEDGSFVESLDGVVTLVESEKGSLSYEFGFTLDNGTTRAISFDGVEIIAAGQTGTITVDDDALATVAGDFVDNYDGVCGITITASIGEVDDDEHPAFTGLIVVVHACRSDDGNTLPWSSTYPLTSSNGETSSSYYIGYMSSDGCECEVKVEKVECPEEPGDSCDTPIHSEICNPESITDPIVEVIEEYAVVSSTTFVAYDTNGDSLDVTASYNSSTNVTTYYDNEGNVLTLGTDFVLDEPTTSTSQVLAELDTSGNSTGVLVVTTVDSEGNTSYKNLSTGEEYTIPDGYSLAVSEDNDYQILTINGCDEGTSIQRITILQNGTYYGSYVIDASTGESFTVSGSETWGALCDEAGTSCDSPLYTETCNPEDISDPIVDTLNSLITLLSTNPLSTISSTEMVVYDPVTNEEMLVTAVYNSTTFETIYRTADGTTVEEGTDFNPYQVATPEGVNVDDDTTITLSDVTGTDPIKTFTVIRDLEDSLDTTVGDITITFPSGNIVTIKSAGTRTWGTGDGSGYIDPTGITIKAQTSMCSIIWEAI